MTRKRRPDKRKWYQKVSDYYGEESGLWESAREKREREQKELWAKLDREYAASVANKRPEEVEYAEAEGFLTEDAPTIEKAGLDDERLFKKAKELREISQGRAPMQPWETDFRQRLNEATNRLYAGAGLGGSNRAAQQRAIRGGLAQKSGEVENSILRAREQEQRVATEELGNLLINARSAGKGAALALANQHQQWLTAQADRSDKQLSSIISALVTLAGVVIMA